MHQGGTHTTGVQSFISQTATSHREKVRHRQERTTQTCRRYQALEGIGQTSGEPNLSSRSAITPTCTQQQRAELMVIQYSHAGTDLPTQANTQQS